MKKSSRKRKTLRNTTRSKTFKATTTIFVDKTSEDYLSEDEETMKKQSENVSSIVKSDLELTISNESSKFGIENPDDISSIIESKKSFYAEEKKDKIFPLEKKKSGK